MPHYPFTCCAKKVAAVSASKSHARKPSTSSACEWIHLTCRAPLHSYTPLAFPSLPTSPN